MLIHTAEPIRLDISMQRGHLRVDYTPTREDMGFFKTVPFTKDKVRKQRAQVLEVIGDMARRGDRLARIEEQYTIADDARHITRPDQKEVNIGQRRPPQVSFTPGSMAVEVRPRGSYLNVLI